MIELRGNGAIVTGAAQGIGLGIALELARAGCRVVIADRVATQAKMAADEVRRETGQDTMAVAMDVTDPDTVQECVRRAIECFSRIDILVNNAGIHTESVRQLSTVDDFRKCFDVNLFGVWRVTQALVPHFRAHRTGKIINIASINGRKPWAITPAYSASKSALINLTQSMAVLLAPDNINVNAVCPGGVFTNMARAFTHDMPALENEIIQERLLKRPLLPEDIGNAVVFLASSKSQSITGQALNVDGGLVMS